MDEGSQNREMWRARASNDDMPFSPTGEDAASGLWRVDATYAIIKQLCSRIWDLPWRTILLVSPNITYVNLGNPGGMREQDGERIPPYNDQPLKRAITQGIDSQGKPLDWPMPRRQMSETDLDDLIAFLDRPSDHLRFASAGSMLHGRG